MLKHFYLVWKISKSQRTILHAPRCNIPEMFINQGQEVLTKLYNVLREFSRNQIGSMPAQQLLHSSREVIGNHQPHGNVVTYTDDRDLGDKHSVMPLLI